MTRRILIGLLIAILVGLAGFGAFAWRPAIARIQPPQASAFPADLVARGTVLASEGYCANCHTVKGGQPLAGGYPLRTAFGTIYSTNITPDAETGIGAWSQEAFRRAMHEGVARDGSHLFPAFPYDHFSKVSDGDVAALYAYLMTRPAVRAAPPRNTVPFPLNLRPLQAGWKLLFFRPGRFEEAPGKSAEWNRGAYLAQGVSHCGACHTPRNFVGAERRNAAYSGAVIDNWIAPALTAANPSPAPWTQDELAAFLRNGGSRYHGVAAGPMAPVARGYAAAPDADARAVAAYFANVGDAAGRIQQLQPALQRAATADRQTAGPQSDPAAQLYVSACASCHYNGAGGPVVERPDLALNSAVTLDDPTNLIRVILYGVDARDGLPGVVMPGFSTLSDASVARVASYLRATRTSKPPWPDLPAKVAKIRAQGRSGE